MQAALSSKGRAAHLAGGRLHYFVAASTKQDKHHDGHLQLFPTVRVEGGHLSIDGSPI